MGNDALKKSLDHYSEHGFSLIKDVIPQVLIDKVFEIILPWENGDSEVKPDVKPTKKGLDKKEGGLQLLPIIGGLILLVLGIGFWFMNNSSTEKGHGV